MTSAKMLTANIRVVSDPPAAQPRGVTPSSFLGKSISNAVEGLDRFEIGIDLPEFPAQPLDMAVDRAIVDIDIVLIGGVHQLIARFHEARPLGEGFQDQEFGDG